MTQYIELKEKDILEISRKYALKQTGFESIEQGSGNTNYLVSTAQKKYVLTVFEIEQNRVAKLCKLLFLLDEYGFPATRLKRLPGGELTTTHRGRVTLLRPYIPGKVVKNLSTAMLRQIGKALAKLHKFPAPDFLRNHHAYGLKFFPHICGSNIDQNYERWLEKKTAYLQENIPVNLPCGLIHGDLFYDNVLFDQDEFKAIIDFEEACHYYLVFDLGMAVVGLCVEDLKVNLNKVRAFINGYQRIRELEKHEKKYLQLFVEYGAIATSAWRFWKYNIDTPISEKSEKHLQMVALARHARAIPPEIFINKVFTD